MEVEQIMTKTLAQYEESKHTVEDQTRLLQEANLQLSSYRQNADELKQTLASVQQENIEI